MVCKRSANCKSRFNDDMDETKDSASIHDGVLFLPAINCVACLSWMLR